MRIGIIVGSTSHVTYDGAVFTDREIAAPPRPVDYALGRFVRVKIRDFAVTASPGVPGERASEEIAQYVVGIISNTVLLNSAAVPGSPRLSSERQSAIFSPDTLTDRGTLVSLLMLGTMKTRQTTAGELHTFSQSHGVPPLSLQVGSIIETMSEEEVQAFHLFPERGAEAAPFLHIGYLPHLQAQPHGLFPLIILQIVEHLERLFPEHLTLLAIIRRNVSWKLKIESIG